MKTIGNILWFVLAGLWIGLGYIVTGALFCITIIGIPFGIQLMKLGVFSFWPFGRVVVRTDGSDGCLPLAANIVWLVLFGWEMFLAHIVAGALLCITIIGIPFGIQAFKLSILALWPFGHEAVKAGSAAAASDVRYTALPG